MPNELSPWQVRQLRSRLKAQKRRNAFAKRAKKMQEKAELDYQRQLGKNLRKIL
jgi:hypothetical protein